MERGDALEIALGIKLLGAIAGKGGLGRVDGFHPRAVTQFAQARFGLGYFAARLGDACVLAARVELQQQLPGFDVLALGDMLAEDGFRGLGRQADAVPFQAAE
ncbi:hypothetical protein FQZ97_602650 [compost metagenome]